MSCESVTHALVNGRLLTAEQEAHLAGCAACARLVGTLRTWKAEPVAGVAPRMPGVGVLERRGRARALRVAAAAAAAALLLGAAPLLFSGGGGLAPPPATPRIVDDQGNPIADNSGRTPAAVPPAPSDVAPADEALVALVDSLDRLDAGAEALPGAGMVALLDPYGDDPVVDPLTGNSAEGDL